MTKKGILLHLAHVDRVKESVPFELGFIEILKKTGIEVWQHLPVNPPGKYDSPYSAPSSFAGDINLLSANLFFDYDDTGNLRTSLGIEARNAVLDFTYNLYKGLQDDSDEKVLDGYDMRLASQIPYIHWADIFVNSYSWNGVDRTDIEGVKIGSEMMLSSNLNLELAYDDKDKKGLSDDWYAKIMFVHPPRQGPTAGDGISGNMWKAEKDMTGELLTKVKRNNKIMIEFKGSSTISRTD